MIIDFHTHTFPDTLAERAIASLSAASHSKAFLDGTAASLRASMKKAGVSHSVVLPVATNPLKIAHLNDVSIRENGKDGLVYFGAVHPESENALEEMDRLRENGVLGVKIHPVYQNTDICHPRFLRILEKAGEIGLCVVMHAGDDIGFPGVVRCSPEMIAAALRAVGPVKCVLAHMGGWKRWDGVAPLSEFPSVYLDTAFSLGKIPAKDDSFSEEEKCLLDREAFVSLVRLFSSERVLFGTDSPWTDQGESRDAILSLSLTDGEKENILFENARKMLHL